MTHDYNLWFRLVDRLTLVDCVCWRWCRVAEKKFGGMIIRVQITDPAVEDNYILYFNFIL